MSWTYLLPRESLVAAFPAPTPTQFAVTAGTGGLFIVGPAVQAGNTCTIQSVVGDLITLSDPLLYTPQTGDPLVQTIIGQKDKVRLLTGDIDTTDPLLQDEEIDAFLTMYPAPLRAAALAAESIAAQFSRKVDYQVYQEISEKMTDAAIAYQRLAKTLRQEAAMKSGGAFMGGLLISQKDVAIADTSKVRPFFRRSELTEPGTENIDTSAPPAGTSWPQY